MKKVFKIIAYGIVGIIGMSIALYAVTFPILLRAISGNSNWLWLYTFHVIVLLWFLGWMIYTEIDET